MDAGQIAVEGYRTPGRSATQAPLNSAGASRTAPVLWRFCFGRRRCRRQPAAYLTAKMTWCRHPISQKKMWVMTRP